jgi:V/A-type H+-transporting ATPase subunit E
MTNKILELTEKIYNDGVVKAKLQAGQIIAEANIEAEKIIKSAKKHESEILEQAKLQAADYKKNTDSEIQLAARQFMSKFKMQLISIVSMAQVEPHVKEAFRDIEFVKNIILTVVQNWNPQKPEELSLTILLPKEDEKELSDFFESQVIRILNREVDIQFDTKITNGFKIGPKNGSYVISFSDKDFENYFNPYVKEKTKQLLFY